MRIELVTQKHDLGCGIACLAMVTGIAYDDIDKQFETNFDKKGMPWETVKSFALNHGFSGIEKSLIGWNHKDDVRSEMLKPFAPVHIVNLQPRADSKFWHVVVMNAKGKLFCPSEMTDQYIRERAYQIHRVFGLFPTK